MKILEPLVLGSYGLKGTFRYLDRSCDFEIPSNIFVRSCDCREVTPRVLLKIVDNTLRQATALVIDLEDRQEELGQTYQALGQTRCQLLDGAVKPAITYTAALDLTSACLFKSTPFTMPELNVLCRRLFGSSWLHVLPPLELNTSLSTRIDVSLGRSKCKEHLFAAALDRNI